jgi:hypothetical protein
MRALDHEIYAKTNHQKSLDEVVQQLVASRQKVSLPLLRQIVVKVMGATADALSDRRLGLGS